MYGPHLRKVLRETGRMNISQCENTVQEMVSAPLTYFLFASFRRH